MNETFGWIILMILVLGTCFGLGNTLYRSQCKNNVQEMGREYRYDFVDGCRIKMDDGTYIFWQMYKNVNITK